MFVDKCNIELKAGDGGEGIVSWRRESHYPEGGPWGGDGGNGGNIFIVGNHNFNSLFDLRYTRRIKADNGAKGGSKLCHGAKGQDYYVSVPLGTVVKDSIKNEIIIDITKHGQKFLICKGGKGGHGNAHFKSSHNKTPKLFERGDVGEKKNVFLEIKYLADVGILGMPNAGKSTLIRAISSAKPKVASYKFTTINPVLGVVENNNSKLIFADIPGLIEGASTGVGLGLEFLKHIERCSILVHLISGSTLDNKSSVEAFDIINKEISKYNLDIKNKKIFIAISKQDSEEFDDLFNEIQNHLPNEKIYKVNSLNEYPQEIIDDIFLEYVKYKEKLDIFIQENIGNEHLIITVEKEEEDKMEIIKISDGIWKVESKKINYWANKIPLMTDDNIVRFNQKINLDLIESKVKELGGKDKDVMMICENEYIIG